MSEILGDKLNIVYEDTLLEITPELMKKTILNQNKEIERLHSIIKEARKYIEDACWLDEVNKPNALGHKQTMKVLEILDKGE